MILTRAPLRITLAGGGTDLPSWYEMHGSEFISVAINKFVYVLINERYGSNHLIKYSELETPTGIVDVKHPIIRECMKRFDIDSFLEITTTADLPGRTGLGSSSSFTVALLYALAEYKGLSFSAGEIAEMACEIEIEKLREPIGIQDQYIASFGGLSKFTVTQKGRVTHESMNFSESTYRILESNLLLFFTGISRDSASLLTDQNEKTKMKDASMIRSLEYTAALGRKIEEALNNGHPDEFGELMHEYWMKKRSRSQGMSNIFVDDVYEIARKNGAIGGKLVGAGGGGFLVLYSIDSHKTITALEKLNLKRVPFSFCNEGASVSPSF